MGINSSGVAVGYEQDETFATTAIRWDAATGSATVLGNLGVSSSGYTESSPSGIDAAGDAVGYALKCSSDGQVGYERAVRWNAGTTVATELGGLGTNSGGVTFTRAYGVNAAGTAVGLARKWSGDTSLGVRAVRWDAGATIPTELSDDDAAAYAINAGGTVIGTRFVEHVAVSGALRWDPGSTVATVLQGFGPSSSAGAAVDINDASTAVGWSPALVAGVWKPHAALWYAGGTMAVDLNTLIDPTSGWVLTNAYAINDGAVIVGSGMKNNVGAAFILTPVPEPGNGFLALALSAAMPRRRLRRT